MTKTWGALAALIGIVAGCGGNAIESGSDLAQNRGDQPSARSDDQQIAAYLAHRWQKQGWTLPRGCEGQVTAPGNTHPIQKVPAGYTIVEYRATGVYAAPFQMTLEHPDYAPIQVACKSSALLRSELDRAALVTLLQPPPADREMVDNAASLLGAYLWLDAYDKELFLKDSGCQVKPDAKANHGRARIHVGGVRYNVAPSDAVSVVFFYNTGGGGAATDRIDCGVSALVDRNEVFKGQPLFPEDGLKAVYKMVDVFVDDARDGTLTIEPLPAPR